MQTNEPTTAPTGPQPYAPPQINTFEIKQFRIIVDCFINSVKLLQPSREVSLCHTTLQRCFHWLGKSLEEAGSQTPYVSSEDPASKTIKPTAEKTDNVLNFDNCPDQTAKVKEFRHHLQEYINKFKLFLNEPIQNFHRGSDYDACLYESKVSAIDAKMWLGWELGRIRDAK